jgi:hypothetical protein
MYSFDLSVNEKSVASIPLIVKEIPLLGAPPANFSPG